MTERRPIVNISGALQELPTGDTLPSPGSAYATIPGVLSTFVGAIRRYFNRSVTLTSVRVDMGTAPASDAVFNVRKNGVVIFTSPKPTVAAGAHSSTPLGVSTALTTADYLTVDVETASGSDAVVRIDFQ
jgi:hypothetical protein